MLATVVWNESASARGHCHMDILAPALDTLVFYVYNFPLIVVVVIVFCECVCMCV